MQNNRDHSTDSKIMTSSVMTEEEYWAQRAEQEQFEMAENARTEEEAWRQHDVEERLTEAKRVSQTRKEIEEYYADEEPAEEPLKVPHKKAATRRKKAAHHKQRCQKKAEAADRNRTSRLNDDVKNGIATVTKEKDSDGKIVRKILSRPGSKTSRADILNKKAYPGNKKPAEES